MEIPFLPAGWTPYVILALVVLVGLRVLAALISQREEPAYMVMLRCPDCRWHGRVSKHNPICKNCGKRI